MKVSRILLGTVAAAALVLTAAASDAVAQKKKKSRCKDGETEQVVQYNAEKGENLPAAIKGSLTGQPGDPEKGVKWMVHRRLGNCIACHQVTKILQRAKDDDLASLRRYGFHGKIAPTLDGVAGRYTEAELRMIVVDPKKAFPDQSTIMPSFHRNDGFTRVVGDCKGLAILAAERVEDIVAFLKTLK